MLGKEKVLCVNDQMVQVQYIGESLYVIDGLYFLISKDIDIMKPGVLESILELIHIHMFANVLKQGYALRVMPADAVFPNAYCVSPSKLDGLRSRTRNWAKLALENYAEKKDRRLIEGFSDRTCLYFTEGEFNAWYVSGTEPDTGDGFWCDQECFPAMQQLCNAVGLKKFYEDYVAIYQLAYKTIREADLQFLKQLSETYPESLRLLAHKVFVVNYAMFVAEENKEGSVLGKRLRRHATELMLLHGMSAEEAIIYNRGRSARDIAQECADNGY